MKTTAKKRCPGLDTFVGAMMGELSESDRESFLSHVSACPACRLKFGALAELESELEARQSLIPEVGLSAAEEKALRRMGRQRLREMSGKRRLSVPPALRLPAAAVAAGLVLIFLGYFFIIRIPSPDQALRGKRSQEIKLVEPGEKLKRAPEIFRWTDVKGKDIFHLSIIDDELNTVFHDTVEETSLRLPVKVRDQLKTGKTYLWTVEAVDEEDRKLASASRYFEIDEDGGESPIRTNAAQ
jgi:hypothetical protein